MSRPDQTSTAEEVMTVEVARRARLSKCPLSPLRPLCSTLLRQVICGSVLAVGVLSYRES